MKKTLLISAIVCLIGVSFAFRQNPPVVKYENLKVLPKNTTKKEMDSIMRHFSLSLGVRCNFCHVRGNDAQRNFNFASDSSKHKQTARSMFKMMNKINKKYFNFNKDEKGDVVPTITCMTCHRGNPHPEEK